MTAVLVDEHSNRRLLRDGFIVVPLISRERAQEIRRLAYDELPHLADPVGSGFYCDMDTADIDRRVRASTLIRRELAAATGALFKNHEPFICNFLQKWPGSTSVVDTHRDWAYVDERAGHRTYTVWIALDDADGPQGQMRVVRDSHRIDHMLRGSNLTAPWLDHEFALNSLMLDVPIRAGEAIVFDNGLTHGSYPNLSDHSRLAVGLAFHDVDHELVHFRRIDDQHAARYRVDLDFFDRCDPRALHEHGPDLPIDAIVAIGGQDYTPEELARVLGKSPLARLDRARRVRHRLRAAASPRSLVAATRAVAARRVTETNDRARRVVDRVLRPLRGMIAAIRIRLGAIRSRSLGAVELIGERARMLRDRIITFRNDLPSRAAIAVLAANEAVVTKFGPESPAIWDHYLFDWATHVERAWLEIQREVDALLVGRSEIPHIEDVTGGIPQGNEGVWRTFVLMHQGRWIDWNCERCPATTDLVRTIPGLMMAGFSVLEPGTHITTHRGPNKGALRYQLGVIVPGNEGDCRIRVGEHMVHWHEGEGVAFDFTVPHEAWNDSSGIRVLLMLEVITPLPWYLTITNRLAQRAMGWFPTTRDITNRLRRLEPTLVKELVSEEAYT